MRLWTKWLLAGCVVSLVAFGCDDDDSGDDGAGGGTADMGAGGSADGTGDGAGGTDDGAGGDDGAAGGDDGGGSGSGDFLRASGTYRGMAFEIECDLDDPVTSSLTSGGYLGHEQCPVGTIGMQCAYPEQGFAGTTGNLTVSIRSAAEGQGVVLLFDGLDATGMNSLGDTSANLTEMTVNFDTYEAGSSASGSFTASWAEGGDATAWGEVTGTFNATCDE